MNCNEGFINIKPWIFHEDLEIFGSKYVLSKTADSQIPLSCLCVEDLVLDCYHLATSYISELSPLQVSQGVVKESNLI